MSLVATFARRTATPSALAPVETAAAEAVYGIDRLVRNVQQGRFAWVALRRRSDGRQADGKVRQPG